MDRLRLVYFADPMCSWCFGFATVMAVVTRMWGASLPVRLVMGGLRPGATEPMTGQAKAALRDHWREVTEASGQAFGASGLDLPGFVYDTDPAARAVVLFRRHGAEQALEFLHLLQRAFYMEGLDVTDPQILGARAARLGADPGAFAEALLDHDVREETWRDYALARAAGVQGYPTLILGPRADGAYEAICRGFQPAGSVVSAIAARLSALAA